MVKPTFESLYEETVILINKRESSWLPTSTAFEDVRQDLLLYIFKVFDSYDPKRPYENWCNVVITRQIRNMLRQKVYRYARPCVAANSYGTPCSFNLGGDRCGHTPSGVQCAECHFYRTWEKKKQKKFAIAVPLSIENHVNEAHNVQSEFIDFTSAKKVIDVKIMQYLTKEEAKIYRLMFIKGLDAKVVGKRMGYSKPKNSDIPGYLLIRKAEARFYELARQIIAEENLTT